MQLSQPRNSNGSEQKYSPPGHWDVGLQWREASQGTGRASIPSHPRAGAGTKWDGTSPGTAPALGINGEPPGNSGNADWAHELPQRLLNEDIQFYLSWAYSPPRTPMGNSSKSWTASAAQGWDEKHFGDKIFFTWTGSNSRYSQASPTAPERKDFVVNTPQMTEALSFSCLLAKTSSIYGWLLTPGTTSNSSFCLPSHTFPSNSHCFPLIFESPPLHK